jgi:hypothetical protein
MKLTDAQLEAIEAHALDHPYSRMMTDWVPALLADLRQAHAVRAMAIKWLERLPTGAAETVYAAGQRSLLEQILALFDAEPSP